MDNGVDSLIHSLRSARSAAFQLLLILPLWLLFLPRVDAVTVDLAEEVSALFNFMNDNRVVQSEGYLITWNDSDHNPCTWIGVTCTVNYTVEELDFSGWELVINDLEALSALRGPRRLNLSFNDALLDLDSIGMLTHLIWLDLSHTDIFNVQSLPSRFFASTNLRFLNFEQAGLQRQISEALLSHMSNFVNLQFLNLAGNLLNGTFPTEELGGLKSLVSLDLSSNSSSGSIPSLPNLTSLPELKHDDNCFTGFEEQLFLSTNRLEYLSVSNNELEGKIPSSIGKIGTLSFLIMSGIYLSDKIPSGFSAVMNNTFSLDLSYNQLTDEIPPYPRSFERLSHNQLTDEIPPCPLSSQRAQWWVSSIKWIKKEKLYLVFGGFAILGTGSFLFAIWQWKVYKKRHQQDADLIKTLLERESATLMPLRELKKATENFAESAQIGEGGCGTVYIGRLDNGTMVAVKRSKHEGSEKDKELFLNEVRILSQIKHRHLVKLLGCCMENKIAVLVFEFISNGTVQEHLQGKMGAPWLSWKQPRGTIGYIDPEYYTSYQLTEKSDVYSFGVVLLELISAKPALDFLRGGDETSLVYFAGPYIAREELVGLIDPVLVETYSDQVGHGRESILRVGKLAMKCLEMRSKARPDMYEVLKELRKLWVDLDGTSNQTKYSTDDNDDDDLQCDEGVLVFNIMSGESSSFRTESDASGVQLSQIFRPQSSRSRSPER